MGETKKESKATEGYFHFQKVEDYFTDQSGWDRVARMKSYDWDSGAQTLTLNLETEAGRSCVMLVQIVTGSILRVRFHPDNQSFGDYSATNTRTVVLDTFQELTDKNRTPQFSATVRNHEKPDRSVEVSFHGSLTERELQLRVTYEPFSYALMMAENGAAPVTVLRMPDRGIKFKEAGGLNDYHIIQSIAKPGAERYVGFGEQGGVKLIRNNSRVTYFNYDNMRYRQVYNHGPYEEREPLYHSDPFFMAVNGPSGRAYGIFVDNPSEVLMDIGYYNSTEYRFGIRYGDMDYYVIAGNDCADIIKSFSNIIGTARLIPRYALGYHQGCYGYKNRREIEEVVDSYRNCQIPLDGIHIDVDLQRDYKTFTVDEKNFPDPKGMFSGLRARGVKCSTNITPIISSRDADGYSTYREGIQNEYFVKDKRYDPDSDRDRKTYYKYEGGEMKEHGRVIDPKEYDSGSPFTGEVYYGDNKDGIPMGTPGHYPDLNRAEVRKWWGRQYQYLFDLGLEMVWQDMTTPCLRETRGDMLSFPSRLLVTNDFVKKAGEDEDYGQTPVMRVWNLYSYNLHKATYHGLNHLKGRENRRNFIIGRGCFTGMQRFAGLWTGDNSSDWEFLRINIPQVLALGLTGQAMSGQDIGGFEKDYDWEQWADPELLIRWTAMGAFLPWFRNHYIRKGKKLFQEPYAYQYHIKDAPEDTRYLYESVLPVCKYFIELRYTLLQLFYDAMFENTLNGMPICRAMFLTNPDDMALFNDREDFLDTQFMVRDCLLVAPILEKQDTMNGGKRDVYLPAGNGWYQFMNYRAPLQEMVEGGTTIMGFDASINHVPEHIPYIVPLYVKEGAIMPVIELEQYVGEKHAQGKPNPVVLYVYPGGKGSYTMYLDDGESRSSQPEGDVRYGADPQAKGEYRELGIEHDYQSPDKRQVRIKAIHDGYTPPEDFMVVGILGDPDMPQVKGIRLNGREVGSLGKGTLDQIKKMPGTAWLYDGTCDASYIRIPMNEPSMVIDILYESTKNSR